MGAVFPARDKIDVVVLLRVSGSFEAGKTKVYTFTTDADKIPEGAYLAAGLSDESGCTVRFGNKHTVSNGYLILGKAR